MQYQELVNWIQLINSGGVGPVTFYKLLEKYQTARQAIKYIDKEKIFPEYEAKTEIEKAHKQGIQIITFTDKEYPQTLKSLNDAPPILYVKGRTDILNYPIGVSIVGARNASVPRRKIASKIAFDLTNNDVLVISGMARGIDAAAHKGALHAKTQKGPTIAVLGTGVDVIYPEENTELYEQICLYGAVISEYKLGTSPQTSNFPRRNRIVSALGSAVLVVDASQNSGSLITARLGLEQGKDIFAVPSSPTDGKSSGTNCLIKEGAVLTENANDILSVLRYTQNRQIKQFEIKEQDLFANRLDKVEKNDNIPVKGKSNNFKPLTNLIPDEGMDIDELIRISGQPTDKVMAQITELEIEDIIKRINSNTIVLKGKYK
ncbi:MAG: DNA-processing protein DprA [Alphaproteobacteria bacterium]|nr:DNA-processing protein DprA [Alphaproteobacteria bacterium]